MTSPTTDRRQGLVGNTPIKAPAACATTANITLSGEQVIDGVQTASSRVLVKNQTDSTQNGLYDSSTAAWTRCYDANGNYDLTTGTLVAVNGGTNNGGSFFQLFSASPITIGTSTLSWGLTLAGSATTLAFLPSGAGAVSTTVQLKLRELDSVRDRGAVIDGVTDDAAAITSELSYQNGLGAASGTVRTTPLLPGNFKISFGLTTRSNGGQSGLVGDGMLSTVLKPTADFTAVTLATSVHDSGNFSIVWPSTVATSARIGIHLADVVNQAEQFELSNVRVDYSYRAFISDPASQTSYLFKFFNVYAFRPLDWGYYLDLPNGSTTFTGELMYVRGDTTGGLPTAKGCFISNAGDVFLQTCAFDQCLDQWLVVQNANTFNGQNLAFESNKIATPGATGVLLTVDRAVINGFKDVTNTYNVGAGNATVIGLGGTCKSLAISGYSEQFSTVVAGTTKYKIGLNNAASHVYVLDDSVLLTEINLNGFFCNATIRGRRMSTLNQAPNYGTWVTGEVVWYATSTGGALGSKCMAGGSPGTWEEFGDLKLVGSKTWAPGAIGNGSFAATPVTVTGARPGDFCLPSLPGGAVGCVVWANCEANDTVQVRANNNTGGSATIPSQTLSVRVFPQ